jgi:hypothetical protein
MKGIINIIEPQMTSIAFSQTPLTSDPVVILSQLRNLSQTNANTSGSYNVEVNTIINVNVPTNQTPDETNVPRNQTPT